LFKKSAAQGNTDAQYNIGWMYYKGEGVAQNKHQAAVWIKKAMDNGNAKAKSVWKQFELSKYL
ncbi:MAG: hypothetical protein L3J74_13495, partial [Bacteroidales bacterium]|nr:hypothetical protein [Bacteroidales bacterium]